MYLVYASLEGAAVRERLFEQRAACVVDAARHVRQALFLVSAVALLRVHRIPRARVFPCADGERVPPFASGLRTASAACVLPIFDVF